MDNGVMYDHGAWFLKVIMSSFLKRVWTLCIAQFFTFLLVTCCLLKVYYLKFVPFYPSIKISDLTYFYQLSPQEIAYKTKTSHIR